MSIQIKKRFHHCIVSIILLSALTSCQKPPIENLPDFIFCENNKLEKEPGLSQALLKVDSIIGDKTGVYVFEEGEDAIISRAWLSQQADQKIDIQYFIFSEDNIGIIACDYMLKAACRGIKIRLIIDDLMLNVNPEYVLALDKHENISIRIYNPNLNIGKNIGSKIYNTVTDFRGVNQRMHHKTFIVDDRVVITGGRNIADEYFDYDHEYNFRDRDVLLAGNKVLEVAEKFEGFWNSPYAVSISDLVNFSDEDYNYESVYYWIREYSNNPLNFWPQIRDEIPFAFDKMLNTGKFYIVDSVDYVSDIPGKNSEVEGLGGGGKTTDALIDLINNAKSTIYIQTPYLVTTELSLGPFRNAVNRGVDIHILTNSLSSTDNVEAFSGYQRNRKRILETGVHIYEYRPDAQVRKQLMTSELQRRLNFQPIFGLHAKSMVVDNHIAVIGTFNLDPRSAHLNTECITIIYNDDVAKDMTTIMKIEQQPENAWRTTLQSNPDEFAGLGKRFKAFTRRIVPKSIL